jgi:hypothetical protein
MQAASAANSLLVTQAIPACTRGRTRHACKAHGSSAKLSSQAALEAPSVTGLPPAPWLTRGGPSESPTPRITAGGGGDRSSGGGPAPRATFVGTTGCGPAVGAAKGLVATAAALPEARGLPIDETVAFLILLRRHVMFGPTLGMTAAPAGGGGAAVGGSAASSARPGASVCGASLLPCP